MLTKLHDLRDRKQVIFIVATNYAERIDAAAKRPGRLDTQVLLAPPDFEGRRRIFAKEIDKELTRFFEKEEGGSFTEEVCPLLEEILDATRLKVFGELKQIFDDAKDSVSRAQRSKTGNMYRDALEEALKEKALSSVPAAITLRSYAARFGDDSKEDSEDNSKEENDQRMSYGVDKMRRPFDEFLVLMYLALENGGTLAERDRNFVRGVLRRLVGASAGEWKTMRYPDRKSKMRESILETLRGDKRFARKVLDLVCKADLLR